MDTAARPTEPSPRPLPKLPSPALVKVVDALRSSRVHERLERIISMFQWETRPTVPKDIGMQVLRSVCSTTAFRHTPRDFPFGDCLGLPEHYDMPEKRRLDERTAILQALQWLLDEEKFYCNQPLAMSAKIPLLLHPRICAHIMSLSSGYANPTVAARIFISAIVGTNQYGCCEWTNACFSSRRDDGKTPDQRCLTAAITCGAREAGRHYGFYGGYRDKLILILQELLTENGVPFLVDNVGPNA